MGWGDCDPSGRSTHRALWPHPWRVSGPGSLWPRLGARTVPHPSPPLPGIPPPLIPTAPPHAAEDSSDLRMFYRRCPCSSCPAPHPLRSRGVGAGGRVPPSLQDPGGWLLKLPIPPLCEPPRFSLTLLQAVSLGVFKCFVCFTVFFSLLHTAVPMTYGDSQARG